MRTPHPLLIPERAYLRDESPGDQTRHRAGHAQETESDRNGEGRTDLGGDDRGFRPEFRRRVSRSAAAHGVKSMRPTMGGMRFLIGVAILVILIIVILALLGHL
jgi:hypothetical protein